MFSPYLSWVPHAVQEVFLSLYFDVLNWPTLFKPRIWPNWNYNHVVRVIFIFNPKWFRGQSISWTTMAQVKTNKLTLAQHKGNVLQNSWHAAHTPPKRISNVPIDTLNTETFTPIPAQFPSLTIEAVCFHHFNVFKRKII